MTIAVTKNDRVSKINDISHIETLSEWRERIIELNKMGAEHNEKFIRTLSASSEEVRGPPDSRDFSYNWSPILNFLHPFY